jgi:hypothetical protein
LPILFISYTHFYFLFYFPYTWKKYIYVFGIGSHYVAQAGLKPMVLLPLLSKCFECWRVPSHPAKFSLCLLFIPNFKYCYPGLFYFIVFPKKTLLSAVKNFIYLCSIVFIKLLSWYPILC